jgi:hypothetical protein
MAIEDIKGSFVAAPLQVLPRAKPVCFIHPDDQP